MESVYLPEIKADFLAQLYPYYNKKVYYFDYNYSSYSYTQQPGYFRKVVVRNYIVPVVVSQNTVILNFDPKIREEIFVIGTLTIGSNTVSNGKVIDNLGKVAITGDGTAFIWIIYNSGIKLNLPTSAMDEMLFDAYLHTMTVNDALPIYMSDPRIIPDAFFEETGINVVKKSLRQGFICQCDKEKVDLAIKLFGNESLAPYVPIIESLPVVPCVNVSLSEIVQISEVIATLFNNHQTLSEYIVEHQNLIYMISESIVSLSEKEASDYQNLQEQIYELSETVESEYVSQSEFDVVTSEQIENLMTQINNLQNVINYLTEQLNMIGQYHESEILTTSEQRFGTITNLLTNELFAVTNGYKTFYNANVNPLWPNQYKNLANALYQIVSSFINSKGKTASTNYSCYAQIVATFNQYLLDNQPEQAFQYLEQSFINLIQNPPFGVCLINPIQQKLIITLIVSLMAMYYTLQTQGVNPELAIFNGTVATLGAELLTLIQDDNKRLIHKKFTKVQIAIFNDAYKYNYQRINTKDLSQYGHEFEYQINAIASSFPNTVAPTFITSFTSYAQMNDYPELNRIFIAVSVLGYSLQLAIYLYKLYKLLTPPISKSTLHKGKKSVLFGTTLGVVSDLIDKKMDSLESILNDVSSMLSIPL